MPGVHKGLLRTRFPRLRAPALEGEYDLNKANQQNGDKSIHSKTSLSRRTLKSLVSLLHDKMPSQPTAVAELYQIPVGFAERYNNADYRGPLIQELNDHIRYYLGFLESIRVELVKDFHGSFDFAVDSAGAVFSNIRHPFAGLYSGRHRIVIANEQRYSFQNICAILAHESTHNYLDIQSITLKNVDAEILTDIAAAYLGFGFVLLKGYETYGMSLGYLSIKSIKEVIHQAVKLRGWPISTLFESFETLFDKFRLWVPSLL